MSTICIGKTVKNKQCKNSTRNESGYCGCHINQMERNEEHEEKIFPKIDTYQTNSQKMFGNLSLSLGEMMKRMACDVINKISKKFVISEEKLYKVFDEVMKTKTKIVCKKRRKITKKDYENVTKKRKNIKWISKEIPKSVDTPTRWKCLKIGCSHEWPATYSNITKEKKPTGCPECAGNRKRTRVDYENVVNVRKNIMWIGKEIPDNVDTPTRWKCLECRHEWPARYHDVTSETTLSGCPKCAGKSRKTRENYEDIINQGRDIEWIGEEVPEYVDTPTRWKCLKKDCNHEWPANYSNITNKTNPTGCPKCSGKLRKTRVDYENVVNVRKNIMWIGEEIPQDVDTPTEWRCLEPGCGHEWPTRYSSLTKDDPTGCPKCAGKLRKTRENYEDIINQGRDIEWIGEEVPQDVGIPTKWKCLKPNCSHIWPASYSNVNNKTNPTGCPHCSKRRNEKECREIIERLTGSKFPTKRPEFIERLEYDGYCEEKNCAFEYNGEQHYYHVPHFQRNGPEDLVKQKERDQRKKKLSEENGIVLIIISYEYDTIDKKTEYIREQLIENGII